MADAAQVNDWMEDLIFSCADDLFRYKGVLAIAGWPDRFIFQARAAALPLAMHAPLFSLSCIHAQTCGPMCCCAGPVPA
jgi:hypothetical protein